MIGGLIAAGLFGLSPPVAVTSTAPATAIAEAPRPAPRPAKRPTWDELSIDANGQRIEGWQDIRVTAGIERFCRDFSVRMTQVHPNLPRVLTVLPGDPCTVRLGEDTVVTGYIDAYAPAFDVGDGTSVAMSGRSKTADLVDCSVEWANLQIVESSVAEIAQKVAAAYDVQVRSEVEGLRRIPQMNLNVGETGFSLIDRTCRYAQCIAFDDADGNVVITRASTERAAGSLVQGVNVERAAVILTAHERYAVYRCFLDSSDFSRLEVGTGTAGSNYIGESRDDGVRRNRKLFFVAESVFDGADVARRRADWENNRRIGRSAVIRVTTSSWRDADGALWRPNTLIHVELPGLRVEGVDWLIAEVTFLRDGYRGTTAELTIMAPEAFMPEPIPLSRIIGSTFVDGSKLRLSPAPDISLP
jgi:prophage tail gpP-like protein